MNKNKEVKKIISNFTATLICLLLMTSAYSQGINPPKYSDEDIESIRFRKGHRIKSYLWRNSDTSEYYIEYYNEAGLIVMTAASGFNTTFYEHNSNGMIVKFYELADGDPNIHYTVTYKDSIISQENWDLHMDFKQRIEYDSEGRRIRDLKIYRNSSRIDSTIIVYLDTREIKTEYENGKAVLIVNSKIYPDSTIREFNKISKHDTIHYLTWSNYFDKRGNKIKRKQTFFDRNQSTEYRNEFNQNNELVSSSTWSNETLKFKTDYRRNQDGKLISSTYNEKDYRTITKYYYSPNGFDAMSVESTFKNGTMTNKEEWYEDYEFYE